MLGLVLLVVAAAPVRPTGPWRDGANVILVTETADPKVFTVTSYFGEGDPAAATWDEASRSLLWGDAVIVVSADGKTLSPTRTTTGKKVDKPAVFRKLTGAEAERLPDERAARVVLKALYAAEQAYFAEKNAYSADLAAIGFVPPSCDEGPCPFTYKVTLSGKDFTATATTKGISISVSSAERGEAKRGMVRLER